ncbi:AAA family ATPase [Serratia fonticola]|uniref:AAA family ATPase n=1 Tax=Serratia fonticola TaxID=47917 RepID=A0ABY9PJN1_SERFO|nr:AAA family ATPase [Serratia fonticola]WMT12719.1 AAA family ATPase [Serratia fonticola]
MNQYTLDKFSIYGFNDEYDISLKTVDNIKIIVSENGQGKTTIINMLYSFLKKNRNIINYNFKSLGININGRDEINYPKQIIKILFKEDLLESLEYTLSDYDLSPIKNYNQRSSIKITQGAFISLIVFFISNTSSSNMNYKDEIKVFIKKINVNEIEEVTPSEVISLIGLINQIRKSVEDKPYFYNSDNIKFSFNELYDDISKICADIYKDSSDDWDFSLFTKKMQELRNEIDELSKKECIYLPTYRVIESNLSFFRASGEDEEEFSFDGFTETKDFFKDNPLIQFGVESIKETWAGLSNRIRAKTTEDFLKLSGQLLTNIVSNRKIKKSEIDELISNKDSVIKVISRIDKNTLTYRNKTNLMHIMKEGEFDVINNNHSALFYILENMVNIYKNQKHIDETLEEYRKVINSFFSDKKVVFNEITSEIYVEKNRGSKKIDIENLSSGEKQILSLFTKIYLANIDDRNKKYWIFYDEPEISLSIEWQEILLPKILDSGRCEFLFAATHSPFIFKEERLKSYTSDLALEVTEII